MKRRLYVLFLLGSFVPATALGQHQSVVERRLLPLTAEQQAANAFLNAQIERAEAGFASRKAELEARIHQQMTELVTRRQMAQLQPCDHRLAAANREVEQLDLERKQMLQGAKGRFPSLTELDKQRAALYWDRDSIRSECERIRRQLEAERPQRIAEEVRAVLPGEIRALEREQERLLASLEQRRHRPQLAPLQPSEPRKAELLNPPPQAASSRRSSGAPEPATPVSKPASSAKAPIPSPPAAPAPHRPLEATAEKERGLEQPPSEPSPASPFASEGITPGAGDGASRVKDSFFVVRAVTAVTAMFQSAQDAIVGLFTDTPSEKLKECVSGKSQCPSTVYAALLRGMNRDAVLKALGPPAELKRPAPNVWGYVLPASDAPSSGYGFLLAFRDDQVVDIKPVPLD